MNWKNALVKLLKAESKNEQLQAENHQLCKDLSTLREYGKRVERCGQILKKNIDDLIISIDLVLPATDPTTTTALSNVEHGN